MSKKIKGYLVSPARRGRLSFECACRYHPVKVTTIIPNFNGILTLNKCLMSLSRSKHRLSEVIVVDNGSTDGSDQVALEWHRMDPRFRLIKLPKNTGYAGAMNRGAENASSDFLIFLDEDTMVHPYWACELLNVVRSNKNIGATASRVLHPSGFFVSGGGLTLFGELYPHYGWNPTDFADETNVVYGITSYLMRKSVFNQIGGFDETFFPAMDDDADIGWRTWSYGYRVRYAPLSFVFHYEFYRGKVWMKVRSHERNQLWCLIKNLNANIFVRTLAFYALWKSIQISYNTLARQPLTLSRGLGIALGILGSKNALQERRKLRTALKSNVQTDFVKLMTVRKHS